MRRWFRSCSRRLTSGRSTIRSCLTWTFTPPAFITSICGSRRADDHNCLNSRRNSPRLRRRSRRPRRDSLLHRRHRADRAGPKLAPEVSVSLPVGLLPRSRPQMSSRLIRATASSEVYTIT